MDKINLIEREVLVKKEYSKELQDKFDNLVVNAKMLDYKIEIEYVLHFDEDFIEFEFKKANERRFRLLFFKNSENNALTKITFYFHEKDGDVSMKLSLEKLNAYRDFNMKEKIDVLFKTINLMAWV